jgi:hypothetical protein
MGLLDFLKKGDSKKSYAQRYKESMEGTSSEDSLAVLQEWGEVSGRFDDANFLLIMATLNAVTDHPADDIEMYLKRYASGKRPHDPSVAGWYVDHAKVMIRSKGHGDLVDKYI